MIYDAEIDLHDYDLKTLEEIKYQVEKFITESYESDLKNIRIITGRGLHSKNRPLVKPITESVLKNHPKIEHYGLDRSLGAFEICLVS